MFYAKNIYTVTVSFMQRKLWPLFPDTVYK